MEQSHKSCFRRSDTGNDCKGFLINNQCNICYYCYNCHIIVISKDEKHVCFHEKQNLSQLFNKMSIKSSNSISIDRDYVQKSYQAAEAKNHKQWNEQNLYPKATQEYIFPNQKMDAQNIVDKFYKEQFRAIGVSKKTKVGADGLMIQIVYLMATHIDDEFVKNIDNIYILTGMSNKEWERDMKEKVPDCLKDKIYHHGKLKTLSREKLRNMKNGLIIIDEIDTANDTNQVLNRILKESDILDIYHMETHNLHFVFISATMFKELYDIYQWGEYGGEYKMTIPDSYIGHIDFHQMGIIRENYSLNTLKSVQRWIKEDILEYYGNDYRVHLVRVNSTTEKIIEKACKQMNIFFTNHTSTDKKSDEQFNTLFLSPRRRHAIIAVVNLFRRANLIPNIWKVHIGAVHEYASRIRDNNVYTQGLIGRMTGYWKHIIGSGHKIGPYRTSTISVTEVEDSYNKPYGVNSYQCRGFKKEKGQVIKFKNTMYSADNVIGHVVRELPEIDSSNNSETVPVVISISETEYRTINKNGNSWDLSSIFIFIHKYNPDLEEILSSMENIRTLQVSPLHENYERLVETPIKASLTNKKWCWLANDLRNIKQDVYNIYLDQKNYNIIVSIYYGSRSDKFKTDLNK